MLSADALAAKLRAEMFSLTHAAWDQFGRTVGEYIQQNAVITYGWSARSGEGTADPATSFVQSAITGNIGIARPNSWPHFAELLDNMVLGFVIVPANGWAITPGTFLGSMGLTLGAMNMVDSWQAAMLRIATQIVTGVKTMINPAPLSGAHGAYVGATTSMIIA